MAFNTAADQIVYPNDAGGILVEVPDGPTIDNLSYFTINGKTMRRIRTGPVRAQECGILSGSDMTSRLQTVLDNASVKTLVFDFIVATDITINGTITVPSGKTLQFYDGNRITGTGSVSGGIIDAGDLTECFASTISLTPAGSTKRYYSARWFGVKGDGVTSDNGAIQKMFDFVAANQSVTKPIYFPRGSYLLDDSILFYNWDGTNYVTRCLEIFGEVDSRSGLQEPMTKFICSNNMTGRFMLGVQRGRAITIRNIYFIGKYNLPTTFSQLNVFRNTAAQWAQVGIRDAQFSPHCAINIDPFARAIPSDGGYANSAGTTWQSYYRGATQGGTSQLNIEGCRIEQVPVGIACSINGDTFNAEIIKIQDCSIAYTKASYALGQSQTKENLVINLRVWEPTRTIFECIDYGQGEGAPPYVEGMNIAGAVFQIIKCASPFSFYASKVFAESLFRIGRLNSSVNAHSITQSDIDFSAGTSGIPSADFIVYGAINFVNCSIRYYDGGLQRMKFCPPGTVVMSIKGGTINRVPLTSSSSPAVDRKYIKLDSVRMYGESQVLLLGTDNAQTIGFNYLRNVPMYGNVKTSNPAASDGTLFISYEKTTYDAAVLLESASLTVNSDGTASVVLSAASIEKLRVNDYLISSNVAGYTYWEDVEVDAMPVLGRIASIVGTTVNLSGCAINIPVGVTASIPIYLNYIRYFNAPIVGNLTSGSNVITNCEFFSGYTPIVGMRLEHPFIPEGIYITAVNSGAGTITLSGNATTTYADATFFNGNPQVEYMMRLSPATNSNLKAFLIEGAEIVVDRTTQFAPAANRYRVMKSIFSTSSARAVNYVPLTGGFQRITMALLAEGCGPTDSNTSFFITDTGKEGIFILDPTDTTTATNSATVVVGVSNARFKRVISSNFYDARWFGNATRAFTSTSDATTKIGTAYRFIGLTVMVETAGSIDEYWWKAGTANGDLVLK